MDDEQRGVRGGSWYDYQRNLRASYRNHLQPGDSGNFVGLRLVLADIENLGVTSSLYLTV